VRAGVAGELEGGGGVEDAERLADAVALQEGVLLVPADICAEELHEELFETEGGVL
jgi:hypothetical protein